MHSMPAIITRVYFDHLSYNYRVICLLLVLRQFFVTAIKIMDERNYCCTICLIHFI